MPETGMTIHHDGKSTFFELSERQAESLLSCASIAHLAPPVRRPTEVEIRTRREIGAAHYRTAEDFGSRLKRLAKLDTRHLAQVLALVDLIDFGDGSLGGANWVLATIEDLLGKVIRDGAAAANEQNPLEALSDLAIGLHDHWDWLRNGLEMRDRHPNIFAPPAAPSMESQPAEAPPRKKRAHRKRAA